MYIHQLEDWPQFRWDQERVANSLAAVRHEQGRLIGRMEALGFPLRQEAVLQALTEDAVKTSEIEGEKLDRGQVRSALARRMGIDIGGLRPADRNVEGVVEMLLDATVRYDQPVTAERLWAWQASLFPTGRSGLASVGVGRWRDDAGGPMQVVSGPLGRERVHYEAPGAARVEGEMQQFLAWLNGAPAMDLVLRAALAHLWFVTVHPFEDGNGRVARALADLMLARSERSPQRFYSMSAQIRRERETYYSFLERTQRGDLDVTAWMEWFLDCLGRAIAGAHEEVAATLRKASFWESLAGAPLNERQRLMVNRLLDGFAGKLTTSKWALLMKCSQDTAHRDVQQLVGMGVLARGPEGGRSTSYVLVGERT